MKLYLQTGQQLVWCTFIQRYKKATTYILTMFIYHLTYKDPFSNNIFCWCKLSKYYFYFMPVCYDLKNINTVESVAIPESSKCSSLADKTQIIVHKGADGKNVVFVNSCSHDLKPDFIILLDYNVLISSFVTRWVWVWIKLHLRWNRMSGDEAWHWADFRKQANLVDLSDNGIDHLAFERAKDDGAVFNWVEDKAPSWLDHAGANIVNSGHRNDEAIFSRAGSLHLREEFLLHSVQ